MDFHSPDARHTYATRDADGSWLELIGTISEIKGKSVADIGCGGGIYCRAMVTLGAVEVTGVDWSGEILKGAAETNSDPKIKYLPGTAEAIPLDDDSCDIVLARALVHHLDELESFCREANRILKPGGVLIIQDRTMDDVKQPASPEHLRGYFFDLFPQLLNIEKARRPEAGVVEKALRAASFSTVEIFKLWETRRTYTDAGELTDDLKKRTGRSILHQLTDSEIDRLITCVTGETKGRFPLEEKDSWTIWAAKSH